MDDVIKFTDRQSGPMENFLPNLSQLFPIES